MTIGPQKNKEFRAILKCLGLDMKEYERRGQVPPDKARELIESIKNLEPEFGKMEPWVSEMAERWRHALGRGAAMHAGTIFLYTPRPE